MNNLINYTLQQSIKKARRLLSSLNCLNKDGTDYAKKIIFKLLYTRRIHQLQHN